MKRVDFQIGQVVVDIDLGAGRAAEPEGARPAREAPMGQARSGVGDGVGGGQGQVVAQVLELLGVVVVADGADKDLVRLRPEGRVKVRPERVVAVAKADVVFARGGVVAEDDGLRHRARGEQAVVAVLQHRARVDGLGVPSGGRRQLHFGVEHVLHQQHLRLGQRRVAVRGLVLKGQGRRAAGREARDHHGEDREFDRAVGIAVLDVGLGLERRAVDQHLRRRGDRPIDKRPAKLKRIVADRHRRSHCAA